MQSAASFQAFPIAEQIPELAALSDAALDPLFWPAARVGTISAWWGHVPFAFWLMHVTRPGLLVELGTHSGVSYSAFCEAVIRERLDTRCFAVDTWEGDEHAGLYDSDVYWDFRAFHDDRYGAFSKTLRSTFDEAVSRFEDGSIDLLHIDGLHTEEAVRHDFETWQSKLSDRAVLLLHDTNEREGDFGVWRFWSDLKKEYPAFEFSHEHGLGVAAIGREAAPIVTSLCRMSNPEAKARIGERFAALGERWIRTMRERQQHRDVAIRDAKIASLEGSLAAVNPRAERNDEELRQIIRSRDTAEAERHKAEAEKLRAESQSARDREQAAAAKREARAEAKARIELKDKFDRTKAQLRQERDAARAEAARLRRELEAQAARRIVGGDVKPTETHDAPAAQWGATAAGMRAQPDSHVRRDFRQYARLISLVLTLRLRKFRAEREIQRAADRIRTSPLFDASWYQEQNPDVVASKIDPALHYVRYGAAEGRNPSSNFDGVWYLQKHADVAAGGLNPLLHFICFGATERRETRPVGFQEAVDPAIQERLRQIKLLEDSPLFDVDWYLEQNPDVAQAGINPLLHYLSTGAAEKRNPGPDFDGNWYLKKYPEVAAAGLNPLLHYIQWGESEGREPLPEKQVDGIEARYPALKPMPVYLVPKGPRRLSIVTDSISEGSLFGGVGTALILSALLAQRIGAEFRLITRTQPPQLDDLKHVLAANGIAWDGNIERVCLAGAKKRDVAVSDNDVFLTTSWWTTYSVAGSVDRRRIFYLLQEDERMFYPFGDERLRCQETLADPVLRFIVNSELLFRHLTTGPDAVNNIRQNGTYFEPAFPSSQYFPEPANGQAGSKKKFFFYARPEHLRNLYWRGLEAISRSIEEGVLNPAEWDFYFVGRSIGEVLLPGNVRPEIRENLSWAQYGAVVRRMDLGLSLMDTPHPSYPPLDLAASGAVVVTNTHGIKTSLTEYSSNIFCSDATVDGLKSALRTGAQLAQDRAARFRNYTENRLSRDWASSLEPVLGPTAEKILKELE